MVSFTGVGEGGELHGEEEEGDRVEENLDGHDAQLDGEEEEVCEHEDQLEEEEDEEQFFEEEEEEQLNGEPDLRVEEEVNENVLIIVLSLFLKEICRTELIWMNVAGASSTCIV